MWPISKLRDKSRLPIVPSDLRLYAVGDIHGRADLLRQVFTKIDADQMNRPTARAVEVFLGDYIDRGPQSRQVIDSLIDMGLVERTRNRRDRRKVNLSLTQKGSRLVIEQLKGAHDHLLKKLEALPKAEIARFKRAVTDLYEITQKL